MRLFAGLLLVMAIITTVVVYGQEDAELQLVGRYDDVHRIRDNFTKETNQFVFTRLIYNGRIPGYYKNWYTDYPRADRNLIAVLKRLTNINIADKERVVPINDPDLFKTRAFVDKADEIWNLVRDEARKAQEVRP